MPGSFLADRWIVLDTETTGLNPAADRIVALGLASFHGGLCLGTMHQKYNPGIPIPPEASAIHGIFDRDVEHCPPFGTLSGGCHALTMLGRLPDLVVGYNVAAFDLPILQRELAGCGVFSTGPAVVDVYAFVNWHLRHLKKRTLSALCEVYQVELPTAHGAEADAKACGELLLAMVRAGIIPADIDRAVQRSAWNCEQVAKEGAVWRGHLYRDRDAVENNLLYRRPHRPPLLMGCGEHQGAPLRTVPDEYLQERLDARLDLPADVRWCFHAQLAGYTGPSAGEIELSGLYHLRLPPELAPSPHPALVQRLALGYELELLLPHMLEHLPPGLHRQVLLLADELAALEDPPQDLPGGPHVP